jgi:hypothetical protein
VALNARATSSLTPRAVSWLWLNRLPIGKLAIIDGDPELGKSMIALDLCARLSTNRPMPDGSPCPGPANCIVLHGEDDPEDTIAPRLDVLGADRSRVFIVERDDSASGPALLLPTNIDELDRLLTATAARLVVIDPIVAFLAPSVQTANDASIRAALMPLARLAEKHQCVILLIRHLNKSRSFRSAYRGGGSIGIVGLCRSAMLVARDPRAPQRCVLAQIKNNLAPRQESLCYEFVADGDRLTALRWLGSHVYSADQLLQAATRPPRLALALENGKDFLTNFLKDGPRNSRHIWVAAKKQSFGSKTLRKAARELKITFKKLWANGERSSYWLLPSQQLPPDVQTLWEQQDLEPWLKPLREQFPPPSPLDKMDNDD